MSSATDAGRIIAYLDHLKATTPGAYYRPSVPAQDKPYANQEAFHRAPHKIRALFPGNGWGKTTALGAEVDDWIMGRCRWQAHYKPPVQVLWICPQFSQFDTLLPQLERDSLTKGYSYNGQKHVFTWPNGSVLRLFSADNDWRNIQGVNPHLIVCDEEPPLALWRELQFRRRVIKTRFILGATATTPGSWMEAEIYTPWLKHHEALGLDEVGAMAAQAHPSVWCWPRGGIVDNPGADDDDVRHYDETTRTMNAKERRVRLKGGFANWSGDCIFDEDALDWLDSQAKDGVNGFMEVA